MKSENWTLLKGVSSNLVGKVAARVSHLVLLVVLARILGPSSFGDYSLAWTVFLLLSVIAPLGVDKGVVKFGSDPKLIASGGVAPLIRTALKIACVSGAALGLLLFVSAHWIGLTVFPRSHVGSILQIFATAIMFASLLRTASGALRIGEEMRQSVIVDDLAQPILNLVLVLIFIAFGITASIASWIAVISFAVISLVGLSWAVKRFGLISRPPAETQSSFGIKSLLAFSIPASMAGVIAAFAGRVDRVILGFFRPSEEIGLYQSASQIAVLFSIILTSFGAIISPMVARLVATGDKDTVRELYRSSTRWTLHLSLPLLVVLVLLPASIMTSLFGEDFSSGKTVLAVISAFQLANIGTGPIGFVLVMVGLQREWFLMSAASLLLNVIAALLFVPTYGTTGAAVVSGAASACLYFGGVLLGWHKWRLWPVDQTIWKVGLSTLGAVIFVFSMQMFVDTTSTLAIGFIVVGSAFAYLAFTIALGVNKSDLDLLLHLRRRLLGS